VAGRLPDRYASFSESGTGICLNIIPYRIHTAIKKQLFYNNFKFKFSFKNYLFERIRCHDSKDMIVIKQTDIAKGRQGGIYGKPIADADHQPRRRYRPWSQLHLTASSAQQRLCVGLARAEDMPRHQCRQAGESPEELEVARCSSEERGVCTSMGELRLVRGSATRPATRP
jgi:hypothetical protein